MNEYGLHTAEISTCWIHTIIGMKHVGMRIILYWHEIPYMFSLCGQETNILHAMCLPTSTSATTRCILRYFKSTTIKCWHIECLSGLNLKDMGHLVWWCAHKVFLKTKPGAVSLSLIGCDRPAMYHLKWWWLLHSVTVQLNCTHSLGSASTSTGCLSITTTVKVNTQTIN